MDVLNLSAMVSYQDGSVVSKEIIKKQTGTVTLFAFDKGQGLSEHTVVSHYNSIVSNELQFQLLLLL